MHTDSVQRPVLLVSMCAHGFSTEACVVSFLALGMLLIPFFRFRLGDLNLGPHNCVAKALIVEPLPSPTFSSFFSNVYFHFP